MNGANVDNANQWIVHWNPVKSKLNEMRPDPPACIAHTSMFADLCLKLHVLEVAHVYYRTQCGNLPENRINDNASDVFNCVDGCKDDISRGFVVRFNEALAIAYHLCVQKRYNCVDGLQSASLLILSYFKSHNGQINSKTFGQSVCFPLSRGNQRILTERSEDQDAISEYWRSEVRREERTGKQAHPSLSDSKYLEGTDLLHCL
ncbi:hypothetical protein CAPTEDRAFT_198259 [Capitella teleta]|uniref:Uncharacterized protein n=1 Tax=Capitella teleta TaxID=283909 RepID=R7U7L8_CAPTE|nr:hypothetical protein CAPTEDRAFT_198259 [Capitella teleta]|eukprot:ELT99671.1 hypothetical protein CAPTEDRAFT_198259 [Capitella teleta]